MSNRGELHLSHYLETLDCWHWDEVYSEYKRIPSRNGYYTPSETHEEVWPIIKAFHFVFLERVVNRFKSLNIRSQRKHQPAAVGYLSRTLNRDIPAPSYDGQIQDNRFVALTALPEEIGEEEPFREGRQKRILVNAYERNPAARQLCIDHFGNRCWVCDLDFSMAYGPAAAGIIHVHHLTPISDIGESYEVDPIDDLRPVCPNCHAVIHSRRPPYTPEEVKEFLKRHGPT